MKNTYFSPFAEFVLFNDGDVISTSPNGSIQNSGADTDDSWGPFIPVS